MGSDSPEIRVGQIDGGLYVSVLGRATQRVCPTVDRVVSEFLGAHAAARVTIDLDGCAWVDSTFAGWLLGLQRRIGRPGSLVRLAGCSERCRASLDRMQLCGFFEFCDAIAPPQTVVVPCPTTDRPDRDQLKLMLDAHEHLAGLGDSNARVFAPVVAALRKQLGLDAGPSR
ncbi:MAG: STAS domain-containing protein [Phycisphaerales bacterium]|nr:STAS domain-containing protein [Phycisphaerales bacterium]